MFMQPDAEAASMTTNALGSSRNIFSSENKPLAETHELMGLPYHDKTVITTRGDLPMSLTQKRAYLHTPNRMLTAPRRAACNGAPLEVFCRRLMMLA